MLFFKNDVQLGTDGEVKLYNDLLNAYMGKGMTREEADREIDAWATEMVRGGYCWLDVICYYFAGDVVLTDGSIVAKDAVLAGDTVVCTVPHNTAVAVRNGNNIIIGDTTAIYNKLVKLPSKEYRDAVLEFGRIFREIASHNAKAD